MAKREWRKKGKGAMQYFKISQRERRGFNVVLVEIP